MEPNPVQGLLVLCLGGLAAATSFIPFRGIRRWSWQTYWLLQSLFALVLAPLFFAHLLIPHLSAVLHEAYAADPTAIQHAIFYGALAGIGVLAFGYAIRFLGLTLGYAFTVGLYVVFTVLHPLLFHRTAPSLAIAGMLLCLAGVALSGAAAASKDRELTYDEKLEAGESDYDVRKGLGVACLAVLMTVFYFLGIQAAAPLRLGAAAHLHTAGRPELWQNLPVLLVVLCGAFLSNLLWCLGLMIWKRTAGEFFGTPGTNPMRASHVTGNTMADFDPEDPQYAERLSVSVLLANYLLAAFAGLLYFLPLLAIALGPARMGSFRNASGALYFAAIIFFATLWGFVFKEWQGTSRRTRNLAAAGIALTILATLAVGYASLGAGAW